MKNATCSPTQTTDRLRRYARHFVLPEIGEAGQEKLLASSALVIGAGGLGCASLGYLAASGIGSLGIVEPDRVELSNLQRQLLFETADIGTQKAKAARTRLQEINPDITIDTHPTRISETNARNLIKNYDIVIDGSDNFETRFVVAKACYLVQRPLISAAISGFSAQLSTFKPHLGPPHPCYRCLVPDHPQRETSCAQEGIISPLAGMIGSLQALEAIKELLNIGTSLSGHLILYNALTAEPKKITLERNPNCTLCGT